MSNKIRFDNGFIIETYIPPEYKQIVADAEKEFRDYDDKLKQRLFGFIEEFEAAAKNGEEPDPKLLTAARWNYGTDPMRHCLAEQATLVRTLYEKTVHYFDEKDLSEKAGKKLANIPSRRIYE